MADKKKELNIIAKLYDLKKDKIVNRKNDECPDFILKHNDILIGVEVTEYYLNEGDARLKNYPGYFEKVMNAQADKRDKDNLSVVNDICIFNEKTGEWELYKDKGILSKIHTLTDYIAIIKDIIEKKNEKAKQYDKSCDINHLVIYDRESRLNQDSEINAAQVASRIGCELKEIVSRSSFDIIFILFSVNKNDAALAIKRSGECYYNFKLNVLKDIDFLLINN